MLPLIRQVQAIMRKHKQDHKPPWNTETGWWIANTDGTPEDAGIVGGGQERFRLIVLGYAS